METIIHASCLKHIYPDKTEVDLCGLDFIVKENERVAILGPSGSGKTTLLRHILGLLTPAEGDIEVFGFSPTKQFAKIRHRIGFVMQNVDEQLTQPTVFDE
ncbi:MAG: ATP-binding cassette domain-containing protein, partial [Patescibacteria group bacterium]